MRQGLVVHVGQDGNVEKALRKLKKKVAESQLLIELRERQQYTKPTTARKMKRNAARARWKKHLRSQQLPRQYY